MYSILHFIGKDTSTMQSKFDETGMTFTLERNGSEITYTFGEHHVAIFREKPEDLDFEMSKAGCEPSDDGWVYFFCATPENPDKTTYIWLDKVEALVLDRRIRQYYD